MEGKSAELASGEGRAGEGGEIEECEEWLVGAEEKRELVVESGGGDCRGELGEDFGG